MNRDDLLVIYSDGITEAQSTTEAFFNEAGILDIVGRLKRQENAVARVGIPLIPGYPAR